jgi:hypothetical protein
MELFVPDEWDIPVTVAEEPDELKEKTVLLEI